LPIPFLENANTTRLSVFVDFGKVWQDVGFFEASELRYSTGISFHWLAPVGPLILNYSQTFNAGPFDRLEHFQFLFGTTF
jgi:outer membrane protein insertion porin family